VSTHQYKRRDLPSQPIRRDTLLLRRLSVELSLLVLIAPEAMAVADCNRRVDRFVDCVFHERELDLIVDEIAMGMG